jgi:hypothetical protein
MVTHVIFTEYPNVSTSPAGALIAAPLSRLAVSTGCPDGSEASGDSPEFISSTGVAEIVN